MISLAGTDQVMSGWDDLLAKAAGKVILLVLTSGLHMRKEKPHLRS